MINLTIVTIVRNDYSGLNKTIDSVLKSEVKCEHLIIDGSDHKLLIHNKPWYLKQIWGKDKGISDAFNKGISLSSGTYILFLNAGDELLPHSGQLISSVLRDDFLDCAWFSVYRTFGCGQKIIFKARLRYLRYAMSAPHQGLIMRKNIFLEIGNFPLQKFSMDHYVALKLIYRYPKYSIKCFDSPIATYPSGGHSSKGGGRPFIYNVWNVLRIRPSDAPFAILANLFLIAKSRFTR